MLHDFLITQKHILLILPSLKRNVSGDNQGRFFAGIKFDPAQALRVLVISKESLTIIKEYQLEAGFAFHFGNAYEDTQGNIYFDASLYPNVDILHQMSRLMQGDGVHRSARAQTVLFTLKNNGQTEQASVAINTEFPRVSQHKVGLQNQNLLYLGAKDHQLWSSKVCGLDTQNGNIDSFNYGDDFLVEEHIPVCQTKDEKSGYVIGTALHVPSKRTCLNVFQANQLSCGPVARAWLPYHLPLGFHGNFVENAP